MSEMDVLVKIFGMIPQESIVEMLSETIKSYKNSETDEAKEENYLKIESFCAMILSMRMKREGVTEESFTKEYVKRPYSDIEN